MSITKFRPLITLYFLVLVALALLPATDAININIWSCWYLQSVTSHTNNSAENTLPPPPSKHLNGMIWIAREQITQDQVPNENIRIAIAAQAAEGNLLALSTIGHERHMLADDPGAILAWLKARDFQSILSLGEEARENNQWESVLLAYLAALSIEPAHKNRTNWEVYIQRSLTNLTKKTNELQQLKLWIDLEPLQGQGYYRVGAFFAQKKLDPQAILWFEKALAFEPNNGKIISDLAWCYYQNNQFDLAVTYLQKAISHDDSKDVAFWLRAGIIFEASSNLELAKKAYQQVLVLEEQNEFAKTHLDALELNTP